MKTSKINRHSHTNKTKTSSGDWHVSHTSMGMGDYYGTGIRAKIGKMREGVGFQEVPKSKLKSPPSTVV